MSYLLPEIVETDRLLLRTWRLEDAERLDEIYSQPEYLEHMPPARGADRVADYRRLWDEAGFATWAACERESGRLIGRIGLLRHDDWPLVDNPVEVGWTLDHELLGPWPRDGGRSRGDRRLARRIFPTRRCTASRFRRTRARGPSWSGSACASAAPRSGTGASTSGTRSTASEVS